MDRRYIYIHIKTLTAKNSLLFFKANRFIRLDLYLMRKVSDRATEGVREKQALEEASLLKTYFCSLKAKIFIRLDLYLMREVNYIATDGVKDNHALKEASLLKTYFCFLEPNRFIRLYLYLRSLLPHFDPLSLTSSVIKPISVPLSKQIICFHPSCNP